TRRTCVMYDPYDDDYPRIVRSTGVAPFWRALAILAMIAAVGAGFIALVLAIALINRPSTVSPAIAAKPAPVWGGGPPGFNGPGAGGAGDDMDEDERQGNLPFPIVRQVDPDTIQIPGEPPPAQAPGDTPRQRFLDTARDVVWKGNANDYS